MKVIRAKVLDTRHLELAEPLPDGVGPYVELALRGLDDEEGAWNTAAWRRFEEAYAPEDSVYDEL